MMTTGAGYLHLLKVCISLTDWLQDVEMNREGKNGYLTLESKRRLKAEAQVSNSNSLIVVPAFQFFFDLTM